MTLALLFLADAVCLPSFHATIYNCPENPEDRQEKQDELEQQLDDSVAVCIMLLVAGFFSVDPICRVDPICLWLLITSSK